MESNASRKYEHEKGINIFRIKSVSCVYSDEEYLVMENFYDTPHSSCTPTKLTLSHISIIYFINFYVSGYSRLFNDIKLVGHY